MTEPEMTRNPVLSPEARRLRSLLASGRLVHPYLSSERFARHEGDDAVTTTTTNPRDDGDGDDAGFVRDNFVDLAAALSICCGVPPPDVRGSSADGEHAMDVGVEREVRRRRLQLASEIGGRSTSAATDDNDGSENDVLCYERRHIVLILCDGMGNSILEGALGSDDVAGAPSSSFFLRNNQQSRLRAVFPSTTPAALTTLATAAWPWRHGMPGWNLRDKKGCDFPGNQDEATQPVQLLVLSDRIRDARSGKQASEMGFDSWDEIFVEVPWARKLATEAEMPGQKLPFKRRRMIYVNAYNGDDYQNWCQGADDTEGDATDFSLWTMGGGDGHVPEGANRSTLFETAKIEETCFETLGKPEGSTAAMEYFRRGLKFTLKSIAKAERSGERTFTYLYTAHPDKHMHALGVEHGEVKKVVKGIEEVVERFCRVLGERKMLLSGDYNFAGGDDQKPGTKRNDSDSLDAAVVVTADHGHVTVHEDDMIELPKNILNLLEYACIGVHGKGRHGYLHCRSGLQSRLLRCWRADPELAENFLLLSIDEAVERGLFGPGRVHWEVRPRLGDFVAVSVGKKTLVSPREAETFKRCRRCQGAHGSLLPEEMNIPFILLLPGSSH